MAYTLKTNIANKKNYGNKRSLSSIKYIVIHYTANDGDTDENNGKYFKNNYVGASAHYFVDDDSVTQSVPDNYVAWSVGGTKNSTCSKTGGGKYYRKCTNTNSISIELCDDVKNGVVYPSAKTIENALELTRKKMKEYNIPKANVIRHFDVTGKLCPAYWAGTSSKDSKWKTEFWNKLDVKKPANESKPVNQSKPASAPTSTSPTKSSGKINTVKEVQDWANKNYGANIVVDGEYGAKTKKALIKILQKELNQTYGHKLSVDGVWRSKTKAACPTLSKGVKNDVVGVLQALLICNGYKEAYLDKDYGSSTYSAVKSYQKKMKLISDGKAGKSTFTKLCS